MKNKPYLLIGLAAAGAAFALMNTHKPVEGPKNNIEISAKMAAKQAALRTTSMTVPGNYLAARFAVSNDDLVSANKFYNQAVGVAKNAEIQDFLYERALPAAIGSGDMAEALRISKKIDLKKPTATSQLAVLMLLVDGFKNENMASINKLLVDFRGDGFGRLLKPLLESWAFVGNDKPADAIARLQRLGREFPSLVPMMHMHMAYVYDLQGDKSKALDFYGKMIHDQLSVRSAYIVGQFYEQQKDKKAAIKLYEALVNKLPNAPLPGIVLKRLNKGELREKPFIANPRDGVSAALYDVATVLYQEGSSRLAVLYAQMAHYLSPDDEFASLLLGDILASTEASSQAETFFASVPETSDLHVLAQLRLAQLYEQQGNAKKAMNVLEKFQKDPLTARQVKTEIGDMYRRREEFSKAIPYYTDVINSIEKPATNDWVIFYARGICYERDNQWQKAETDLEAALKLSPQQPEVLNYLAYTWADHGKNLPKALAMLQKALDGAPDDPYITDSVGWALHKNGQSDEAVPFLETAVQGLPEDPVINDHLGDIYWAVGRDLEAQFQWERALKNTKDTDKKLREQLEKKLKEGLPRDSIVKSKTAEELAAPQPENTNDENQVDPASDELMPDRAGNDASESIPAANPEEMLVPITPATTEEKK